MAPVYQKAALAKAVGERDLHRHGPGIRHRIEMRIEPRHQPLPAALDDASGFDALLVILEALLGRQAGHADVIAGLAVPFRVTKKHHVDVVVVRRVGLARFLLLPRHRETAGRPSVRAPAAYGARGRSAEGLRYRRCRWPPEAP